MGKGVSEYQRAYQTSPTRLVEEAYENNWQYRKLRRSAEMAHRVFEWPDENEENKYNEVEGGNAKMMENLLKKSVPGNSSEKQASRSRKTQTPKNRQLALEVATQTPGKSAKDVAVNGEVTVIERESRSSAKKRSIKAGKSDDKPIQTGCTSDVKPSKVKSKIATKSDSEDEQNVEPKIDKLNIERDDDTPSSSSGENVPPKIDIVELLKGVKSDTNQTKFGRKRVPPKKRSEGERLVSVVKPLRGRAQALFKVESNRPPPEVNSNSRPKNLYLFGAADHSRNGVAVKRTYNVLAPQSTVHETALRAAQRRQAERVSAKSRKKTQRRGRSTKDDDEVIHSVEQSEFEKWMRRETSQWTTEYRSNFKKHDRSEYARNREMAARCGVLHDDEDLIAVSLNPNYGPTAVKANQNSAPSTSRSASSRITSMRSAKSAGSNPSRF